MKKLLLLLIVFFVVIFAAQAQTAEQDKVRKWLPAKKIIRRDAPVVSKSPNPLRLNISYRNATDYLPDTAHVEHSPLRYLRINVHFMNASDRAHNYDGEEAIRFAKDLIDYANQDLQKNNKLWLPYRNKLPVIPPRYQYQLSPQTTNSGDQGIYFHYDDRLCYYIHKGPTANLFETEVLEKHQIGADSVLNVFIMPHHPDSMKSAWYSKTAGGVGVMLGNAIKMAGMYEGHQPAWAYRGILNHEAGHFLGLSHAFFRDGCDDTPEHGNPCWSRTTEAPCDTAASNNMMDYNALQNALSPCQIGTMHARMADTNSYERRFLVKNWCTRQEGQDITIRDTVVWKGDKDLTGHVTIVAGGVLRIEARLSLPENARITLMPGAELQLGNKALLHNACGLKWEGIEAPRRFFGARGKVLAEDGARIKGARFIDY